MQHKNAFTSSISPLGRMKEDGESNIQRTYGGKDTFHINEHRMSAIDMKKNSI